MSETGEPAQRSAWTLAAASENERLFTEAYLRGIRDGLSEAAEICEAIADQLGLDDGFSASCCYNGITTLLTAAPDIYAATLARMAKGRPE